MKITKAKLKQIIKEELSSINEVDDWYSEEHETLADKKFAERGAALTTDPDPQQAMEDIYFESNFLKMIQEDFLMGYLPPRQDEIIADLKGVISDYLARLQAHSGDTQAIGE